MTRASEKHIVAMAGGGFSMEPRNLRLDRYVLGLVRRPKPKVCFLPTASGDAASYIRRFHRTFQKLGCKTAHLSLFPPPTADLEGFLGEHDLIYVGGGNTKSMLALWRDWGIPKILKAAWERGTVLAGVSAGAICWFREGVTDSIPGAFTRLECLGFFRDSFCPHYDSEPERQPAYRRLLTEGTIGDGYAGDDGVAFHFQGEKLFRILASRPQAKAFRLERTNGKGEQKELPTEYLEP